jgi:hypothetical protein
MSFTNGIGFNMQTELLLDAKATLGEGPAWDAKTQTLYWVDILEKRIYAGVELLAQLDDLIGCLAPCKNGNLILGLSGIVPEGENESRASFVDFAPDYVPADSSRRFERISHQPRQRRQM